MRASSPGGGRKRKAATPDQQGGAAEAYERKKQRAKDARVKLNEAIEELSIAIQLAGTQSEQRAAVFSDDEKVRAHLQEGVNVAQSAKKWDRPGFVGSAAKLIHNLNAQSQCLLQKVVELQQQLKVKTTRFGGTDFQTIHL